MPLGANTAHHHAPLVAWVTDISKAYDMTSENGTPATTVRAFYEALSAGSGDQAASFIVPERRFGPFSPDAMTKFYGALIEPLKLISVDPGGANNFVVRYNFRSSAGRCTCRAEVSIVNRNGSNFIYSIRALTGC